MPTIISILSDQLIPNVLFIKQMAKAGDFHIFLTSEKMERGHKSAILADTLELAKEHFDVILIDPERPSVIMKKLESYRWPESAAYIVNVTGGTKMMSQAVSLFFSRRKNTSVFYWPIDSNFIVQLYPKINEQEIKKPALLNLKTYFRACGYEFTSGNRLSYPFEKADAIFQKVVTLKSAEGVPEIAAAKDQHYLKPDKGYYLGGWFEEWLYHFLKTELRLSGKQIAFNLKLKSRDSLRKFESDNEIDIAFVYQNKLFLWECKVYYPKSLTGKKIGDAVYKISSLSHTLGLQAISLVAIMTPFGSDKNRKNFIEDITRTMKVRKVFSLEDMEDKSALISVIKRIISHRQER